MQVAQVSFELTMETRLAMNSLCSHHIESLFKPAETGLNLFPPASTSYALGLSAYTTTSVMYILF